MIDKPYGEMSLKETSRQDSRLHTVGDMRRKEIQAEIDLRQSQSTARFHILGYGRGGDICGGGNRRRSCESDDPQMALKTGTKWP